MNKSKRLWAVLVSAATFMGLFSAFPLAAHAADIIVSVSNTGWAEAAAPNLWGGGTIQGGRNIFVLYTAPDTILYCLEPGAPLNSGYGVNVGNYADTLRTPSIHEDGTVTRLLGRLFQYIDYSGTGSPFSTDDGKALYVAARMLVWELTQGERDEDFAYVAPPAGYNRVREFVDNSSMAQGYKDLIYVYYSYLENKVQNHHRIPSFARMSQLNAPLYELTDNGGTLSATLNDNAGVLASYHFSGGGMAFTKSENQLTAAASGAFGGEVMVTATHATAQRRGVICYGDGGGNIQDTAVIGSPIEDPIVAFFRLKVAMGNLSIIKTTQNNGGLVGGFQFEVKRGGTPIGTFTSAADGHIFIPDLFVGTYTVREIGLTEEFVQPAPNPVTVEVRAGQTATVNFNNVKKLGILTVQKSNANPAMGNYSLAGAQFSVKNVGGAVVDVITTAADGKGQSKALPLGTYTVQETKAPWGFVVDPGLYTRTLSGSLGTAEIVYASAIPVPERPQTGRIKITKLDAETGASPQGNATLAGAVFDLLDAGGRQVERIYCGTNNYAVSKEVPLGSYVVKEVTPPLGYTLSQQEYPVKIDYAGQEAGIHLVQQEVHNAVIKGRIQLVKHSDAPDPAVDPENPQVQQPMGGIVFEVFLKAAGSYEAAKEAERDLLTTDENGYASTRNLPYGVYTVKEVQGAAEHSICAPFDVFISQNGRIYYYIVENTAYYGKVKVVKTDAETGKTIPVPNIEFKIKNTDTGEWVSQEILYPTPVVLDSYLTNAEGWLVMPKPLLHGNYELHEVQAPNGYVLTETPVAFTVTSDNPVEFLEFTMPNMPVKGQVTVTKTGEVLSGARRLESEYGNIFVPEYTTRGIAGAVFSIIAAEDIVTPDGTVRAAAGEVVDSITSDENGSATSKELYLGHYFAVETAVPHGFVLDETPLPFSLVYADQHTPLVSAETGLYNERAQVAVKVIKTAEEIALDEKGEIVYGQAPALGITFGLFARGDIENADGEVILPAGSLLDVLTTGEGGAAVSSCDIPFGAYYVKELATRQNLVPSSDEYDVLADYQGGHVPLVTVVANNGSAIKNHLIKGKIKVVKIGEEGQPLSGVVFSVTSEDTGYTATLLTDENGVAETGLLPYGRYRIVETKTQAGYVLDEHEHSLFLVKDSETYEFSLTNRRIRGKIELIKTDRETKEPLEGVVFEVFDSDGNLVATLTTGADGTAITDWLFYGPYTVKEKTANDGYSLDDTVYEIWVAKDKTVYPLHLQNSRIPLPPPPPTPPVPHSYPQTGDNSNMAVWCLLFGTSAAALAGAGLYARRKKREDEINNREETED